MSAASGEHTWGAVELGGTTIKVALARGCPTNVVEQRSFPTGQDPKVAMQVAVDFFKANPVTALAVGSFGPVDLNENSKTYGYITSTPKAGWADTDVLSPFRCLSVPLGFSTDVNTAAFGEISLGQHGDDVTSAVYVTVGTGIGCGVVVNGQVLTGLLHPEGGHIPVRRHPNDPADKFAGVCPYHGDCLEGLATANAIAARLGIDITELSALPDSHQVWEIEAHYLAQLCTSLTLLLSPHVIILGGGVLHRRSLFPLVRAATLKQLNGYIRAERILAHTDKYIVQSRFDKEGSNTSAGAVGTLAYAKHIWEQQQKQQAPAAAGAAASNA